jgi:hypothetical protein
VPDSQDSSEWQWKHIWLVLLLLQAFNNWIDERLQQSPLPSVGLFPEGNPRPPPPAASSALVLMTLLLLLMMMMMTLLQLLLLMMMITFINQAAVQSWSLSQSQLCPFLLPAYQPLHPAVLGRPPTLACPACSAVHQALATSNRCHCH